MWRKRAVKAFTLIECLVALLVLSGSVLVYQGLTQLTASHVLKLANSDQERWLLFCEQLRHELAGGELEKVESDKLYLRQGEQSLAFGLSKSDDFRKTHANGRGYQPMLYGITHSRIIKEGNRVCIQITFKNGQERTFLYAFEETT